MLRQPVECGDELLAPLGAEQGCLRGGGRLPGRLLGGAERQRRAPAGRAAAVARLVRDDAQQPRLEGRPGPEPPERAVRLHERVLRRLLGVGGVPGEEIGGSQRDALVCVHQLLVGVGVAPPGAGDELGFVEWPAHHCCVYTPG